MKKIPLLASLALAACTVGPDYRRPAVEVPAQFPAALAPQAGGLAADWWKLYGDAALDELVETARRNNSDLRLAAARVQEAEGALREARAALFPDVSAGYSYTRNRVSTVASPPVPPSFPVTRANHQALASTSYELDFWGRYARASEAAQAGLLGSIFSRDVVELTLVGAVAQAYFALRSLDAQIAVLDSSIKGRQDSLEIARARLDAGLAPELDVYQAQSALADLRVQRRDAVRGRAVVEHQLAGLTGKLDLALPAGELFKLPLAPVPPAGLPSALLERRPDIRQAEETLVAANAQIGVARAALFPSVSLTAAFGGQSSELADLFTGPARIWTLGAGVAAPVFDAGRRSARVDQAVARRDQALAGYRKAIETGFREVSDALVNVEASAASEDELEVRLQAARNALELSNARYQAGYSPYLEVLDAQRTANDAELAFVRNRQARLSFSVDLMKALGGGWQASEFRSSSR
ncbi:MAG TPA: efflux transporter outer membrane subunit [Burkholderiales bacterium]|nr:efflux transporter outer membrane subunit [Burkholderiales bacterium]